MIRHWWICPCEKHVKLDFFKFGKIRFRFTIFTHARAFLCPYTSLCDFDCTDHSHVDHNVIYRWFLSWSFSKSPLDEVHVILGWPFALLCTWPISSDGSHLVAGCSCLLLLLHLLPDQGSTKADQLHFRLKVFAPPLGGRLLLQLLLPNIPMLCLSGTLGIPLVENLFQTITPNSMSAGVITRKCT